MKRFDVILDIQFPRIAVQTLREQSVLWWQLTDILDQGNNLIILQKSFGMYEEAIQNILNKASSRNYEFYVTNKPNDYLLYDNPKIVSNNILSLSCLIKELDLTDPRNFVQAESMLCNTRSFNSMKVNQGILVKSSENKSKLKAEATWYQEISKIKPHVIPKFYELDKSGSIHMEYMDYPTLSEQYVSDTFDQQGLKNLMHDLFAFWQDYSSCDTFSELPKRHWSYKDLYINKYDQRLKDLLQGQNSDFWQRLTSQPNIIINSKHMYNLKSLNQTIRMLLLELPGKIPTVPYIMHGDYCFSNILRSSRLGIFKLIDPRGVIGKTETIFGDPQYDLAKLRHSIVGLYDFIVRKQFVLHSSNDCTEDGIPSCWNYKIHKPYGINMKDIEDNFDAEISSLGFDPIMVQFIEAYLFLSMIPLHADCFERQKVLYLIAIEKFNKVKSKMEDYVNAVIAL